MVTVEGVGAAASVVVVCLTSLVGGAVARVVVVCLTSLVVIIVVIAVLI